MRRDVQFTSEGDECAGWLYLPDKTAAGERLPAIVMANAITAVREIVLPAYAVHFADAGFACLAFDYRYFGASGGEPRGHLVAAEQIADIRNAVSWMSGQPEIDSNRIGLWGASYGGAHVLSISAFDKRIKAAVATAPTMRTSDIMVRFIGREGLAGVLQFLGADRTARYLAGETHFMKAVSDGSEPAMLPNPEAFTFFTRMGETIAPSWRNQVTVESMEKLIEYDPTYAIDLIAPTPLLMVVGENDQSQPPNLSRDAYARAGEPKRMVSIAAGHTELLDKEEPVAASAAAAIDWFRQYLV